MGKMKSVNIIVTKIEADVIEGILMKHALDSAVVGEEVTTDFALVILFLKKMKEAFGEKYTTMPKNMLKMVNIASKHIGKYAGPPELQNSN